MKILVLGATGMAGHVIATYFKNNHHDVYAITRRATSICNHEIGDITDFKYLSKHIECNNYDAIINAIGILNQDAEDNKYHAVYLNSLLPHFLVETTKNSKTKIIHMSTDCVFSGDKGSYNEDDFQDGKTFYDRSKALGEINNGKDLTFRNSIIGPDINEKGIGLFNWFMKQSGTIFGYDKAIWTGVTTITLAKAMEKALEDNLCGLYNLVNNKVIDKYSLISLFNKHMKNSELKINRSDHVVLNKSLVCNRNDFNFIVPTYEDMVIEMNQWIKDYSELYKHYR